MKPFRILVFGIGGVGGYFGGHIAKTYQNDPSVEVIFVARGDHLKAIKDHGLSVVTPEESYVVHPDHVTDDCSTIGPVDLVMLCTKSYHLQASVEAIKPALGPKSYVLPLLNGVHIHELVEQQLPKANVLQGCVYVNAYKTNPGEVTQKSVVQKMIFGKNDATENEKQFMDRLNTLLEATDINLVYTEDALKEIWTKYAFISSTSAITCLTDKTFGAFREDAEDMEKVSSLIKEIIALGQAKGINITDALLEKQLGLIQKFPPETITSMQLDMRNGFKTEVETMVGYVPSESKKYNVSAPVSSSIYAELRKKLS